MKGYFKHSASPLYVQVADALREKIVNGQWPIDSLIPSLPQLAQEYGVGLITVRLAVQLLRNEQLLEPKQGAGTYVKSKPKTHPQMRVETSLHGLADLYRNLAPRVIPLGDSIAMPLLQTEDGLSAPRYRCLHRAHSNESQITSVITAYIDERVFKKAPKRFRKELIIPVLTDLKDVEIFSAKQILTVGTAGVEAASALNIATSAPVARLRRVFCAKDGTVIYLGELTYRGDFVRLEMDLMA